MRFAAGVSMGCPFEVPATALSGLRPREELAAHLTTSLLEVELRCTAAWNQRLVSSGYAEPHD